MNKKRIVSLIVSCILLLSGISYANQDDYTEPQPDYRSFTGILQGIDSSFSSEITSLRMHDSSGNEATLVVSEKTLIINEEKLQKGVTVTGFYDASRPMIMIYPPHYSVDVVIVIEESQSVKRSRFDEDLLSADQRLKLIPGDERLSPYNGVKRNFK